jgi:hypothetical protein
MDGFLTALLDESVRLGAAVSVIVSGVILGSLVLLNKWQRWWISYDIHEKLLASEAKRADKAEADANDDRLQLIADLAERMTNFRADHADRMRQASEDHGRALATLTKILDSKDRDIESWRTAWNLSDQANREEEEARWNEIRAALLVMQRFVTEIQRAEQVMRDDGRGAAGVR